MYYTTKAKTKQNKVIFLEKYFSYIISHISVFTFTDLVKEIFVQRVFSLTKVNQPIQKKKKSEVSKEETFKENMLSIWSIYILQTVTTCIIFGHDDDDQGEYF